VKFVTFDPFGPHALAVVFVTGLVVLTCVLLHYEAFTLLSRRIGRMHVQVRRRRILLLMFALIALHVAEIWLFGIAYFMLGSGAEFGSTVSAGALASSVTAPGSVFDFVYFSATVYTTLGFGDLVPNGAIRFMTGTEAITGFLLISWSASFTFLEMQRFWKLED
jgi:hypothetical protein